MSSAHGLLRRALRGAFEPLLRRALLRGLRPPRVGHTPPLTARAWGNARVRALRLTGARNQQLAAWLIRPPQRPATAPVPAVLALHEWGANASSLWPVVGPLLDARMAVMLLDASCHGDSGHETFTSLPRFAEDLDTALRALRAEPGIDGRRLALLGHSVGERFDRIAPINLVSRLACPLLLVHGARDTTVPALDAQRLHAAQPDSELLIVDGDHDLREALAPRTDHLVRFLQRHLGTAAR